MGRLNKPAIPNYTYRSPEQTNARDITPNLGEDYLASQAADTGRINRGLNANAASPSNRMRQQEAGGRAILRNTGRAALMEMALQGGKAVGEEIEKRTGVGKKFVNESGLGDVAEKAATAGRDKVELSKDAKERIAEDKAFKENEKALQEVDAEKESEKYGKGDKYAKGGSVSASRRGDGIAQRGKTRGKMC